MSTRLLYVVSHPIQYQAPLLRRIAAQSDINLKVLFQRDTEAGYFDPGFGRHVHWDLPLRHDYDSALIADVDLAAEIAKADTVWLHGWQGRTMRQILRRARRSGKPVLMRGENTDAAMPDGHGVKGWVKSYYLQWLFDHVTAFLAIGSDNRDYYRRRGIADERIFDVPYAIDNQAFADKADATDKSMLRRDLGLDPTRAIILYSGKLIRRKHPHTLLAAWRQAPWLGPRPYLLFIGDGEMSEELGRETDPDVRFLGFRNQSELPGFYTLADLFVLASEAEPWGLAVNEAMACGTAAIVGKDIGCARDLINPQCGATVPAGNAEALASTLVNLLSRADIAGKAARNRIAGWDFDADIAGLRTALAWLEAHPCA